MDAFLWIEKEDGQSEVISENCIVKIKPFIDDGERKFEILSTHLICQTTGPVATSTIAREIRGWGAGYDLLVQAGMTKPTKAYIKQAFDAYEKMLDEFD